MTQFISLDRGISDVYIDITKVVAVADSREEAGKCVVYFEGSQIIVDGTARTIFTLIFDLLAGAGTRIDHLSNYLVLDKCGTLNCRFTPEHSGDCVDDAGNPL